MVFCGLDDTWWHSKAISSFKSIRQDKNVMCRSLPTSKHIGESEVKVHGYQHILCDGVLPASKGSLHLHRHSS